MTIELHKLEVEPLVGGVLITELGSGKYGDEDETVAVYQKDIDNLVVVLHAYSNMLKFGMDMSLELKVYQEYIVVNYLGSAYTIVGYLSVDTYSSRTSNSLKCIGESMFIKEGLKSLPQQSTVSNYDDLQVGWHVDIVDKEHGFFNRLGQIVGTRDDKRKFMVFFESNVCQPTDITLEFRRDQIKRRVMRGEV
jgi:hypothetical protein